METEKITQEEVDKVHTIALAEWERMKSEFDGSDVMFAISKNAVQFLAEYEQVKDYLAEEGFTIPKLVVEIDVTLG